MDSAETGLREATRCTSRADFSELMGAEQWRRLPAAVRQRFASHTDAKVTTYRGRMAVRASFAGRCFAWACCLIGTPVALCQGADVPVTVHVIDRADGGGTIWQRHYDFADRPPSIVRSTKLVDERGDLLEALGAGLNMRLEVFEQDRALHFRSTGYFFQMGRLRLALPDWLPPGVTHVIHEDLGDGHFRFSMRTTHAWWGEMFWQDGIFEAVGG
jgi:hypothetical protein